MTDENDSKTQELARARELGTRLERLAGESEIPLLQDHAVTGTLAQIPPATDIPPRLYSAVAAVLSFLRDTEQELDPR